MSRTGWTRNPHGQPKRPSQATSAKEKAHAQARYHRRMLDGSYKGFDVVTESPGIAVVTFNQPEKMNGIGGGMKRDLREIMLQAQLDGDTRVVVVTGSGGSF